MHSPLVVTCSFGAEQNPTDKATSFFLVDMGASEARRRVVCMPEPAGASCPKLKLHRLHINTVLINNRQVFYL